MMKNYRQQRSLLSKMFLDFDKLFQLHMYHEPFTYYIPILNLFLRKSHSINEFNR